MGRILAFWRLVGNLFILGAGLMFGAPALLTRVPDFVPKQFEPYWPFVLQIRWPAFVFGLVLVCIAAAGLAFGSPVLALGALRKRVWKSERLSSEVQEAKSAPALDFTVSDEPERQQVPGMWAVEDVWRLTVRNTSDEPLHGCTAEVLRFYRLSDGSTVDQEGLLHYLLWVPLSKDEKPSTEATIGQCGGSRQINLVGRDSAVRIYVAERPWGLPVPSELGYGIELLIAGEYVRVEIQPDCGDVSVRCEHVLDEAV